MKSTATSFLCFSYIYITQLISFLPFIATIPNQPDPRNPAPTSSSYTMQRRREHRAELEKEVEIGGGIEDANEGLDSHLVLNVHLIIISMS